MGFIANPQSLLLSSIIHITGTHLQTHAFTDKSRRRKTNNCIHIVDPAFNTAYSLLFYKLIIGLNVRWT